MKWYNHKESAVFLLQQLKGVRVVFFLFCSPLEEKGEDEEGGRKVKKRGERVGGSFREILTLLRLFLI